MAEFKISDPSLLDLPTDSLDAFLQKNATMAIPLPRSIVLDQAKTNEVLENFAAKHELTVPQAIVVITILFQSGGTNRSCDANLQANLFNKNIKLSSLRKSLAVCKVKDCERKFARSLADEIAKVASFYKIPGNLSLKIQRLKPQLGNISMEILVWLSDFQSSNPNCPPIALGYINEAFSVKVPKKSGTNKPKNTGK